MKKFCRILSLAILAQHLVLAPPARADAAPATGTSTQTSHVDSASIAEWLKKKKRS